MSTKKILGKISQQDLNPLGVRIELENFLFSLTA